MVGWLVRSSVIAGVLISVVGFAIALALLHRLAREELGARVADSTVLLLAFAPLSFFFTAVYTESLFLALSVGASIWHEGSGSRSLASSRLRRRSRTSRVCCWWRLAYMYWRSRGQPLGIRRFWSWAAMLLVLPPQLASFFVYLHSQGWGWFAPVANANFRYYGRTNCGARDL